MSAKKKPMCEACGRPYLIVETNTGARFEGCVSARVLKRAGEETETLDKLQTCECGHGYEDHDPFTKHPGPCRECDCKKGRADLSGMRVQFGCAATQKERAAFAKVRKARRAAESS